MKRLVLLAGAFLFVFGSMSGAARACTCSPFTPEEEFVRSDAVFKGLVIAILPSEPPGTLDVHVMATGYWKGTVGVLMHVYTSHSSASCGYRFDVGTEYLIYSSNTTDPCCPGVRTSLCHRTQPLASAQMDLDYLGDPLPVPVDEVTWGVIKSMYVD
jgi:hypothetical protein